MQRNKAYYNALRNERQLLTYTAYRSSSSPALNSGFRLHPYAFIYSSTYISIYDVLECFFLEICFYFYRTNKRCELE